MIGIEREGSLEAAPGPGVFLPGELGIAEADVEFYRIGVEGDSLAEESDDVIVAAFVVELMGLFVEIVGAAECIRHRLDLHEGLWVNSRTVGWEEQGKRRANCRARFWLGHTPIRVLTAHCLRLSY